MTYSKHNIQQTLIRCKFSPELTTGQRYIYTGSYAGTVYVYDMITGEVVSKLNGHNATVRDLHWHPTKPLIVTSSWDNTVLKWECGENNFEEQPHEEEKDTTVSTDDEPYGYED